MIKYIDYDSIDEYGVHVKPINSKDMPMVKLASNNYSSELMEIINNFERNPKLYYVVINALGSLETWGPNRNGDAFPRKGLSHHSLRSDMGTGNDYGYKTFEYYARLFKHHLNKPERGHKDYGEIIFSHWNPKTERVELIVGIDREKGADIIEANENGEVISVSMGCKVRYDLCNICLKKSKTVEEYCIHLKNYMGQMVTPEQAAKWSKEVGRTILPGTIVFAQNDFPRFFDISKVWFGAEPISFVMGKVASNTKVILSAHNAEAYGVTDEQIDKLAIIGKQGVINKEIGSPEIDDPDGKLTAKAESLKKSLNENIKTTIENEDRIPNNILDPLAKYMDVRDIFSTMFGLGIHPKPAEFQRIIIIKTGDQGLADHLDRHNLIFDKDEECEPATIDVGPHRFNDVIAKALMPYLEKRSMFPDLLEKRMQETLEKKAQLPDYEEEESKVLTPMNIIMGLAALFAGLKLKAMGIGPQQMIDTVIKKPWIGAALGSGIAYKLLMHDKQKELDKILIPAHNYEDVLKNTYFSGRALEKKSSIGGSLALGALTGLVAYPAAYLVNAYNQRSLYKTGKQLFPGAGASPKAIATGAGGSTAILSMMLEKAGPKIKGLIKRVK